MKMRIHRYRLFKKLSNYSKCFNPSNTQIHQMPHFLYTLERSHPKSIKTSQMFFYQVRKWNRVHYRGLRETEIVDRALSNATNSLAKNSIPSPRPLEISPFSVANVVGETLATFFGEDRIKMIFLTVSASISLSYSSLFPHFKSGENFIALALHRVTYFYIDLCPRQIFRSDFPRKTTSGGIFFASQKAWDINIPERHFKKTSRVQWD